LRHSFNSALANAGISQEVRMKLTGHSTASINTQYTHHELAPLRSAIERLPSVLSQFPEQTVGPGRERAGLHDGNHLPVPVRATTTLSKTILTRRSPTLAVTLGAGAGFGEVLNRFSFQTVSSSEMLGTRSPVGFPATNRLQTQPMLAVSTTRERNV
jgi:hypothetical protein